ncbi:MAG: ATP-binding protein [Phycisphaerales bacterium]|nr:ATP-binding protein [Phycisphaerales bacterium]
MARTEQANPDHARISIANKRDEIERAEQRLIAALDKHQYPDAAKFAVRLALEEALVNAFRHGHKGLSPDVPVELEFRVTDKQTDLAIEDKGPGFDPGDVPDPTLDENLTVPTGRGLLLMRAYMARVEYVGKGNRVEMVYKKP